MVMINDDEINDIEKYPDWPLKIPKKLHLYWNGEQFSIMNYMTIKSFIFYNPEWEVNIYAPIKFNENIVPPTWNSDLQKYKYTGKNYFDELKKLNVIFRIIDFDKIGFYNDANDIYKSDFLRYTLLYEQGGLWSDFDILYTKKLNNDLFKNASKNCDIKNMDIGIFFIDVYFPIGFLLSSPKNDFFKKCMDNVLNYYRTEEYQSIGTIMCNDLFKSDKYVLELYPNVCILDEKRFIIIDGI